MENPITSQKVKVFVSYSWKDGKDDVGKLVEWLRKDEKIEVISDHLHKHRPPAQGWQAWMLHSIEEADIVLCICGETFKKGFEKRDDGGLGIKYESSIVTMDLYESHCINKKFFPILPEAGKHEFVPKFLIQWNNDIALMDYDKIHDLILPPTQHDKKRPSVKKIKPKRQRNNVNNKPEKPRRKLSRILKLTLFLVFVSIFIILFASKLTHYAQFLYEVYNKRLPGNISNVADLVTDEDKEIPPPDKLKPEEYIRNQIALEHFRIARDYLKSEDQTVVQTGMHSLFSLATTYPNECSQPVFEELCNYLRKSKPKPHAITSGDSKSPLPETSSVTQTIVDKLFRKKIEIKDEISGETFELFRDQKANLSGAYLRGVNFKGANLRQADLQGACLGESNSGGSRSREFRSRKPWFDFDINLQWADLTEANLRMATLIYANLQESDLREAKLQGAYLLYANLQGANLSGAKLQGAYLGGTNLQEANLIGAELQGATFISAGLRGQNFMNADFRGAQGQSDTYPRFIIAKALKDGNGLKTNLRSIRLFDDDGNELRDLTEDEKKKWLRDRGAKVGDLPDKEVQELFKGFKWQ